MNKRILKLIIVFIITFTITTNVQAKKIVDQTEDYKLIVDDSAELLTTKQIKKITEAMYPITTDGNVVFKSIDKNTNTTESYIKTYFYHNFQNGENAIVFLIDMSNRMIYIYSDGDIYKVITSAIAEEITNNVYKYASIKRYDKCAYYAFEQIDKLIKNGKISDLEEYKKDIILPVLGAFAGSLSD